MSPPDASTSKRKLDDYVPYGFDGVHRADAADFQSSFKMSRLVNDSNIRDHTFSRFVPTVIEIAMAKSHSWKDRSSESHSLSTKTGESSDVSQLIQFFVKINGKSVAFRMNRRDTVFTLHEKLQSLTGIRVMYQLLIFGGRQLHYEQTLEDCLVERDCSIQLVSRMRSTLYPFAFQVTEDIVSIIMTLCTSNYLPFPAMVKSLKGKVDDYITAITSPNPRNGNYAHVITGNWKEQEQYLNNLAKKIWMIDYLKVFLDYDAPKALCALYRSPFETNKECADDCIRCLVGLVHDITTGPVKAFSVTILLEFCRLLMPAYKDNGDDSLYLHCRSALASTLKIVGLASGPDEVDKIKYFMTVQDILPYLREVVGRLKKDILLSMESNCSHGPIFRDVNDFSLLMYPLRILVEEQIVLGGPISAPTGKGQSSFRPYWEEILLLSWIFNELCALMDRCLEKMESHSTLKGNYAKENFKFSGSQYLPLLKELYSISKLYKGAEDLFWNMMRCRKTSVHDLILKFATKEDNCGWLFPHKEILNFESRRHLAMLMFPEVKEDYDELHEMLVDRSDLLSESFEYISNAEPSSLHAGLFIEFHNEEATGPGVMREWFLLVCQAIFNPDRALFVACPLDRRRFFPNPESKVDQLHLEYFRFAGRVIALSLIHKIQIGIRLDRVLFLQLAEMDISLEDIRDADPSIYTSCKQILEMDSDFIDSDALGLTFVREAEVLGSRKVVELCPGGKQIVVNSRNRHSYVKLLVEHAFVKSISEQVTYFTAGFADILTSASNRRSFFQCLELEDLDKMLHGSDFAIPVEDWKLHTDYRGYDKSDPQISWFWEVVGEMCEEQRRALLFFWTSVKYLPMEGFDGLGARLHVEKSFEASDHLPSSHTCFFKLSIPSYPSKEVMRDRFHVVTKEHLCRSFGTL